MKRAGGGWLPLLLLLLLAGAGAGEPASKLPSSSSSATWVWPLPRLPDGRSPTISDHYGWSPARGRVHRGVDVDYERDTWLPKGTKLPTFDNGSRAYEVPDGVQALAARAGKVKSTQTTKRGQNVVLDHGDGWQTFYQHLRATFVTRGDRVEAGQALGEVGYDPSGHDHVRHLHFELWGRGGAIDPEPDMKSWPVV